MEVAVKMLRETLTNLLIQAIPFQLILLVGISFSLIQNLVKLSFAVLQLLYRSIQTTYSLYLLVILVYILGMAQMVNASRTVSPEDLNTAMNMKI